MAVSATSDSKVKFQVITDAVTYTYDVSSDGEASFYPLQSGSASYTFRLMQNTTGDKYLEAYATSADVEIADERETYLYPNFFVSYDASSACVAKAAELAAGASSDVDVVSAVYAYITKNVAYDYDFAENPPAGYCPDPDTTLSTGKGICFDYASLAAAMLRSQGIPCKLITGYVSPNDVYHAWNMIYLEGTGWITVEIKADPDSWERIDTTFAATGGNNAFVGDGTNYTDRYTY